MNNSIKTIVEDFDFNKVKNNGVVDDLLVNKLSGKVESFFAGIFNSDKIYDFAYKKWKMYDLDFFNSFGFCNYDLVYNEKKHVLKIHSAFNANECVSVQIQNDGGLLFYSHTAKNILKLNPFSTIDSQKHGAHVCSNNICRFDEYLQTFGLHLAGIKADTILFTAPGLPMTADMFYSVFKHIDCKNFVFYSVLFDTYDELLKILNIIKANGNGVKYSFVDRNTDDDFIKISSKCLL